MDECYQLQINLASSFEVPFKKATLFCFENKS